MPSFQDYLEARNRHLYRNYSALAFRACNTYFSSYEMRAFSHSKKAQRFSAGYVHLSHSFAIVSNLQNKYAFLLRHRDVNSCSVRVTKNIRESFLNDAENGSRFLSG